MKKILFILLGCIILVSCDDFLNTESLTQKDSTNFPTSPNEANQLLTNCYTPLSGIYPLQLSFYMSEIMSDNCLGGGDAKDTDAKLLNTFSSGGKINRFSQLWTLLYTAIYRCNTIILSQDMVEWETGQAGLAQKNFILGQAHFLRAYYYFELAKTFENVPLQLTNEVTNPPQAAPDKTYAQIASDLKTAIEMLPGVAYTAVERGRVTRWAAEGYMARIFLFYTGYYGKENMPLNDGSSISKQQVLDWLEDCITNSGHDLVPDFRSLWPYSYQNPDFPDNTIYQYVQDNNIPAWVGDGNIESVFAAQKTSLDPGWSGLDSKTNQLCVYYGLRMPPNSDGYFQATFPFGRGWGQATVNSNLWEQWPDNDLRKRGSILHIKPYDPNGPVDDPVEGIWMDLFTFGADGQTEETGFWNKKYMPVNAGNRDRGMFENYSHQLYNNVIQDFQRDNLQDVVFMRYADILLMAAELGSAQAGEYFNRVHQRGVPGETLPVTPENILDERRWEFAFEGLRYYDLLRFHREDLITTNQTNITVWNEGVYGGKVNVVYRSETRGFLPIPENQIELSGGVLKPNSGW